MSSDSMNPDLQKLEAGLRDLTPNGMDEALLARLEAAIDGSLVRPDATLSRLETELAASRPAPLDAGFLASLEKTVAGTPFPLDEKILLFPKSAPVVRKSGGRPMIAAAAAVALLGAAAALFMPTGGPADDGFVADHNTTPAPSSAAAPAIAQRGTGFTPVGFDRNMQEATDEGVLWNNKVQPHRVVRVIFEDKVTFTDAEGKTVEMRRPRVEYIIVPENVD